MSLTVTVTFIEIMILRLAMYGGQEPSKDRVVVLWPVRPHRLSGRYDYSVPSPHRLFQHRNRNSEVVFGRAVGETRDR
jgi:hypothetical protein